MINGAFLWPAPQKVSAVLDSVSWGTNFALGDSNNPAERALDRTAQPRQGDTDTVVEHTHAHLR